MSATILYEVTGYLRTPVRKSIIVEPGDKVVLVGKYHSDFVLVKPYEGKRTSSFRCPTSILTLSKSEVK